MHIEAWFVKPKQGVPTIQPWWSSQCCLDFLPDDMIADSRERESVLHEYNSETALALCSPLQHLTVVTNDSNVGRKVMKLSAVALPTNWAVWLAPQVSSTHPHLFQRNSSIY